MLARSPQRARVTRVGLMGWTPCRAAAYLRRPWAPCQDVRRLAALDGLWDADDVVCLGVSFNPPPPLLGCPITFIQLIPSNSCPLTFIP